MLLWMRVGWGGLDVAGMHAGKKSGTAQRDKDEHWESGTWNQSYFKCALKNSLLVPTGFETVVAHL